MMASFHLLASVSFFFCAGWAVKELWKPNAILALVCMLSLVNLGMRALSFGLESLL